MSKLAVIKTGGKQYLVEEGTILDIEKLADTDGKLEFNEVLLVDDGKAVQIGTPNLEKASVSAEVMQQFKDDKVKVFKMKRRKRYRRNLGHRQELTKVKIVKINA